MPRRSRRAAVAALLATLLAVAAGPAAASALDDAKAAGWVGERTDGFVGLVRSDAPPEVRKLVEDVNTKRRQTYTSIAKKNGTTVVAVAALAGQQLVAEARPGHYVQDENGRWVKR